MTEDHYVIEIDRVRKLIRLTLLGLWDMPVFERYRQEQAAAYDRLLAVGVRSSEALILVDLREFLVQSQDVARELEGLISGYANRVARVAVIASKSALQNMQTKRVASTVPHRVFSSEQEAMTWLIG